MFFDGKYIIMILVKIQEKGDIMKYFKCGHIMTTHGLKGDVKVKSLSDFHRFYVGSVLYILHNGEYVKIIIDRIVPFKEDYLFHFEGFPTIDSVLKFHSEDLFISEADRKDVLEENEYYYSDLIGKLVINEAKEERGVVVEVRELPQAEYLVVEWNHKNVLIPFIDEFVLSVGNEIVIKEIEGLF